MSLAVLHPSRSTLKWVILLAGVVGVSLVCGGQSSAAEATDGAFDGHLAAGEFGPARAIAEAAPDVAIRDHRLGKISAAQANAGARRASIDTASYIQDDRIRSGVLRRVGSQGPPVAVGRGGAAMADFSSLIELITTTVAPDTWDDVGGPGAIDSFAGGVYVDTAGELKRLVLDSDSRALTRIRRTALAMSGNRNVRKSSSLRKISLTRLEKQVQLLRAMGYSPDDAMRNMAGLQKIQYVFIYPESGDIVIAGPAGPWHESIEGRALGVESGRPVVQLDDFVTVLRNAYAEHGRFGCSIEPRKENLAKIQAFLADPSKNTLRKGRAAWLAGLRDSLGKQDIVVNGIDPRSRAARVLVEADYRMKLVGMGLEDGTLGVTSYLNSVKVGADGEVPPMDVLRWWFTLNYDAVNASERHDAFELRGQGAKVLSENELLTDIGERVHTGKSDELNHEFAHSFTKHFDELSAKYPIYADLRNIFDLALVAGLIRSEDLPGQVGWHMTYFGDHPESNDPQFEIELGTAPREVETVINHRLVGKKHVIAGVSGGVHVDTQLVVNPDKLQTGDHQRMQDERVQSLPRHLPQNAWWWD